MTMSHDRDMVDATRHSGGQLLSGAHDDARPVILSAIENGALLRTAIKSAGFVGSLALHAGAAVAMLLWFESKPGAVADLTEAISIEIITTDVIEAMELAPRTATSAAASSPDVEAGSAHDAPAQRKADKIEPTASEPIKEPAEQTGHEAPRAIDAEREAAEARPQDAEPRDPPAAAELMPMPEITAKLDEALVEAAPSGEEAPAKSATQSQPEDKRAAGTPVTVRPPHKAPQKESKEKNPRSKTSASAPSRKGGDPSRGAQASKASAARTSASTGAAINYAAIVRARVASRRPSGRGQRGTVQVTFGISPSGGLSFASVSRSSGDPNLDRSVLAAVRGAAPFPTPPAGASLRQRQFSMPFHFQ